MIITNRKGCTAFSLNVDGKEEIDMTTQERLEVIEHIYQWMKNTADQNLNYILQALTEKIGEYNVVDDKPCECCGDIVTENILTIP